MRPESDGTAKTARGGEGKVISGAGPRESVIRTDLPPANVANERE